VRVLVTGASGLLGWWLVRVLHDAGYRVYAAVHRRQPPGLEEAATTRLDLEDPGSIYRALEEARPDLVLHAAAYTDVDGCEQNPARALRVNYHGAAALAKAAARRGTVALIYISTDYVFPGTRGLYREEDPPRPVNYYGLSKLLGEAAAAAHPGKAVAVRVSGLYGYSPTGKRNFGITVLERLLRRERVKAFRDQRLSPTYVPDLASRITRLIEALHEAPSVLHLAGPPATRLEYARALARLLGAPEELIEPASMESLRLPAPRPRDSSLDTARAREMGLAMPGLEESLARFIRDYNRLRREYPPPEEATG